MGFLTTTTTTKEKKFWTNWAGQQQCWVDEREPQTELEIQQIFEEAKQDGRVVRVVGSGHSPNGLAAVPDGGIHIRLTHFQYVERESESSNRVRVGAGLRLTQLHEDLDRLGLGLSVLGAISDQTVGGVLATSTHGTGVHYGSLSTLCVGLRIVLANGRVEECGPDNEPDLFRAACCSLGVLGVVTEVTFRCEPAFHLRAVESHGESLSALLQAAPETLAELAHSAEHVRLLWIPHTDRLSVWRASRAKQADSLVVQLQNSGRKVFGSIEGGNGAARLLFRSAFLRSLVAHRVFEFLLYVGVSWPRLVPWVNWLYARLLYTGRVTTVGRSDRVFNYDCFFKQHVTEWAVPLDRAREALEGVRTMVQEQGYRVHLPVEIRFVAGDPIWLSPSSAVQPVCYIGLIMYRPYGIDPPQWKAYFSAFEALMTGLGGRPHWAKDFEMTPQQFALSYPHWKDFWSLARICDPYQLLHNRHIQKLLSQQ